MAGKGFIPIVVKRIMHHSKFDDEDNLDWRSAVPPGHLSAIQ